MVTRAARDRHGGTLGCLVTLLLFLVAIYYGGHVGEVYWRYFDVLETMKFEAGQAAHLSDVEIRNRLAWKADSVIPGIAPAFSIQRTGRPGRIIIEAVYRERVVLPFFDHYFDLHPRAEAPL